MFVKRNKKYINDFFKDLQVDLEIGGNEITIEKTFETIASIDFKPQDDIFRNLIKHRKFSTFLIRGEKTRGQDWLIHQLVKKYLANSEKIIITSPMLNGMITLKEIIIELQRRVHAKYKESNSDEVKLQRIAEKFALQEKEYHIVVDCSNNFVASEEFCTFYDHFISHITPRAEIDSGYKKVLFLKDYVNSDYSTIQQLNYWCCKMKKDEDKFYTDWEDNTEKPFVIDLQRIESFDLKILTEWRENVTERPIRNKLKDKETIERLLKEEYENGNPKKIIDDICNLINYTY